MPGGAETAGDGATQARTDPELEDALAAARTSLPRMMREQN
ncbi:hypothetical protein [Streptomyces sp. NPDC001315]